ncbi:head-tail connector protein [Aliarcobacter butzleri]
MLELKVAPTQTEIDAILSLASAKEFLKVVDTDEDNTIKDNILSAIAEVQGYTNRQFAKATYELYLPNFPRENFKFPKNPVNEIISIEYMDLNGDYQTLDESTYYLYEQYQVGKVEFEKYPNIQIKQHKKAVKITFTCGYSEAEFPKDLRQYLKVKVSTLFEFKEEIVSGTIISKTNHIDSIIEKYKIRSV